MRGVEKESDAATVAVRTKLPRLGGLGQPGGRHGSQPLEVAELDDVVEGPGEGPSRTISEEWAAPGARGSADGEKW